METIEHAINLLKDSIDNYSKLQYQYHVWESEYIEIKENYEKMKYNVKSTLTYQVNTNNQIWMYEASKN